MYHKKRKKLQWKAGNMLQTLKQLLQWVRVLTEEENSTRPKDKLSIKAQST